MKVARRTAGNSVALPALMEGLLQKRRPPARLH
jgi:hypothetical protein